MTILVEFCVTLVVLGALTLFDALRTGGGVVGGAPLVGVIFAATFPPIPPLPS